MIHIGDDFLSLPDSALDAMDIVPAEIADAIEDALRAKAQGRLHVSPKAAILPGQGRYMMSTLAVGDDGLTVVKQVTVSPDNPGRGLPAINGAIMVLDAETGKLRAVLGANWVTAHRTAALSAVAARRLVPTEAETIAFVGCGVQARSHLLAFHDMFRLRRVLAVGRGAANVTALCDEACGMGLDAAPSDADAALRAADIVVTSVTLDYTIAPFLDARCLQPHAYAAITDLCIPWLPKSMGAFGTVIVDDLEQETSSEKPMLPVDQISGDLTGLVTTDIAPKPDRPTAFVFRGIALGDYAAAALAIRRAEETGAGQRIA
ncbi:MAG: ornithine cyclodeaminase family protein [Pseudomonadota bacterium]